MALEIEVKAYAPNLRKVEENLEDIGALALEEGCEIDTYYIHPSRNFKKTGEALRIRVSSEKAFMTYKGEKIDALSKTREEIEIEISDAKNAALLLERLGFKPITTVKKIRKKYRFDIFEISLDDVEHVGTFVEAETTGDDMELFRDKAIDLLKVLGLKTFERKSYLELLIEKHNEP